MPSQSLKGTLQLQECRELLGEAKKALEEGRNYTYAIEASGEVVDAGGQVVGAGLRHDCLCVRAAALLKVLDVTKLDWF